MNELRCQHWSRCYAAALARGLNHDQAKAQADASMCNFNRRWSMS
ncbi:hypothetical protein [Pseudomonas sp. NBRC 111127]|nr:hypothetical protein [Pseudomonas sp. NBRC 111127]